MFKYMLLGQLLSKCFLLEQFFGTYYMIIYNYWITNNTSYIFTIFTTTCCRIPNTIFWIFTFTVTLRIIPLLNFWFKLHLLLSNLHSHLHDICFVNVLDVYSSYLIKHAGLNLLFHLKRILYISPQEYCNFQHAY